MDIKIRFDVDKAEKLYTEHSLKDAEYMRLNNLYCQADGAKCRFDPEGNNDDCGDCPHFQSDKEWYTRDTLLKIIAEHLSELLIFG